MPDIEGMPEGEQPGWANTSILINGTRYPGVTSFTPPEIQGSVENVFGQGTKAIGWGKGNQENQDGSMAMSRTTYNTLLMDISGGDPNADIRQIPLTIVVIENPSAIAGAPNSKTTVTYEGVRIKNKPAVEMNQGDISYNVTLTLTFTKDPVMVIADPDGV